MEAEARSDVGRAGDPPGAAGPEATAARTRKPWMSPELITESVRDVTSNKSVASNFEGEFCYPSS